jgi:hypothetical protein
MNAKQVCGSHNLINQFQNNIKCKYGLFIPSYVLISKKTHEHAI